jgi:hypothetical protein
VYNVCITWNFAGSFLQTRVMNATTAKHVGAKQKQMSTNTIDSEVQQAGTGGFTGHGQAESRQKTRPAKKAARAKAARLPETRKGTGWQVHSVRRFLTETLGKKTWPRVRA